MKIRSTKRQNDTTSSYGKREEIKKNSIRSIAYTLPEELRLQYRDRSWATEMEQKALYRSRTEQRDRAREQRERGR